METRLEAVPWAATALALTMTGPGLNASEWRWRLLLRAVGQQRHVTQLPQLQKVVVGAAGNMAFFADKNWGTPLRLCLVYCD